MSYPLGPLSLHDCERHGPGSQAELLIVEGDSAAKSVVAVRAPRFQAVLPMQGKPLNAMKARSSEVERYALFQALVDAMGYPWGQPCDPDKCRFEKLVLLLDPDADGIHCGALLVMFFYRYFPALLKAGRISMVHPPLVRLSWQDVGTQKMYEQFFDSMEQAGQSAAELESQGFVTIRKTRYRGLASIEHSSLLKTCVALESRRISRLGLADAEAMIAVFGK